MIQTKILEFIDWLFNTKDNNRSTRSEMNKLIYCRR